MNLTNKQFINEIDTAATDLFSVPQRSISAPEPARAFNVPGSGIIEQYWKHILIGVAVLVLFTFLYKAAQKPN